MIITGVDTGMHGALVTVGDDGDPIAATILRPGKRAAGWKTPSPPEVSSVSGQIFGHLLENEPEAITYETVAMVRGIAPSRSLFITEGLLLASSAEMAIPIFGVQQQTLRGWVKKKLGIEKWERGKAKEQILEALPMFVLPQLIESVVAVVGACPKRYHDDLAEAYLCALWGQATIEVER